MSPENDPSNFEEAQASKLVSKFNETIPYKQRYRKSHDPRPIAGELIKRYFDKVADLEDDPERDRLATLGRFVLELMSVEGGKLTESFQKRYSSLPQMVVEEGGKEGYTLDVDQALDNFVNFLSGPKEVAGQVKPTDDSSLERQINGRPNKRARIMPSDEIIRGALEIVAKEKNIVLGGGVLCNPRNSTMFESRAPADVETAKLTCLKCPQLMSCLAKALSENSIFTQGGTTKPERNSIRSTWGVKRSVYSARYQSTMPSDTEILTSRKRPLKEL